MAALNAFIPFTILLQLTAVGDDVCIDCLMQLIVKVDSLLTIKLSFGEQTNLCRFSVYLSVL